MADDVTKNINYNYRTNIDTLTSKHRSFDRQLGRVTTRTEKWQRTIGKSKYKLTGFTESTRNAAQKTNRLSSSMKGLAMRFVGYNLIMGMVMGAQQKVIEFIKESITKFREFEKAVAEVSTILTSVSMDKLPGLSAGLEVLSIQFGRAATDMARGMYRILSAAFDAEDALRLLNTATRASVAGLSTVAQSVDIFTSVLNAYGMTVSQAATLSDLFFQTVVRGKLKYEDLGSALGYVTPIAANAGIEFKEIAGVFSTATRMGLHLDMVSRGLALGIQGLISPTEGVTKAAKKYGIEIGPLAVRTQGLTGMIQQLHAASEQYGSHIISELIPNMRSFRVFAAMAGEEGVMGLMEDMDLLATSFGRTEEAMGKMMNTTSFMADVLEQNFEAIQRSVGESLTDIQLEMERTKQALIGGIGGILEGIGKTMEQPPYPGALILGIIGGFKKGADEVNNAVKENIELVKQSAIKAFTGMLDTRQEKSLFETLIGDDADVSKVVGSLIDVEQIAERINIERDIAGTSEQAMNTIRMMMGFGHSIGSIYEATQGFDKELQILNLELFDSQRVWDDLTGALDTFGSTASGIEYTISQLTIQQNNLKEEIGDIGNEYDGTLGIQLKFKEDVKELEDKIAALRAGIKGEGSDLSALSQDMKDHIALVKKQKEAYDDLSIAMKKNNLEIMKIQLKGMLRRRGMTRSEEKAIKKFQIDNTKIRIDQLGIRIDAEEAAESDSKTILNKELEALRRQLVDMKDTRQDDIDNLRDTITEKETALDDSYTVLKEQQAEYERITGLHTTFIASLYETMTTDIMTELEKLYGFTEPTTPTTPKRTTYPEGFIGPMPQYGRGTHYVPETMHAIVHRGEQIIPAGSSQGAGGNVTIYNTINATINNDMDVEELAAKLSQAESNNLMKRGKTNYKLRIG